MFQERSDSALWKVSLAGGFVALLVGVLAAYRTPATEYELSLYAATPTTYWVGLAVALVASLAVAFGATTSWRTRAGAYLLSVTSLSTLVLLPRLRGYYYFGGGDSMTHLGWTRDIVAGRLDPTTFLYPGIHTTTVFVSRVVGVGFGTAQLYVTLAYVLLFVLFVALSVRLLGAAAWAPTVGLFAGLLVLPNNNVSVHVMAHPITQSLLLVPLVVYLVVRYVIQPDRAVDELPVGTPVGILLGLVIVALVFVHPQGALTVVAILGTIVVVQLLARRLRRPTRLDAHHPLYVPTLVGFVTFALWTPRYERVRGTAVGVVDNLVSGSVTADEIAQRSSSLADLGGSIVELFVVLFLVSAVFSLLAGLLVLGWLGGALDDRYRDRNGLLTYVIVSLVPLSVAFGVFFAASVTTQHFRFAGFLMVPITILGAVAISDGAGRLRRRFSGRSVRVGLVVVFLLMLALPLATVHSSPIIYQPSDGTTEMRLDGIETTVAVMNRSIPFAGVRFGPRRLVDAIYGTERDPDLEGLRRDSAIPGPVFGTNLTRHYDSPRYVPVSDATYDREVTLYEGLRYSADGFEQLRYSPAVSRVYANGGYRLYLLDNRRA